MTTQPYIRAIGTAVPPHRISQQDHYTILEKANHMSREDQLVLKKIYSKSGIEHRYSVLSEFGGSDRAANELFHPSGDYPATPVSKRMQLYEQYALGLCRQAATQCFDSAQLPASAITHVITFSCTGMYAPGLDIQLVEEMGLKKNVERTCINFMGCYAAINALKYAYHIVRSRPESNVLLVGVELCSLHYRKSNEANQVVANALFGDGAAAAIVSAKEGSSQHGLRLEQFYSEFEQASGNEMVWRIGDSGFDLLLTPEVPRVVKDNIAALIEKLFLQTGITQEQIDFYAIHPGGMKILEACEQALHLSKQQNEISYGVLRDFGNMSSVTILFVLKKYLAMLSGTDTGKKILCCAFGPGITVESMILEVI